MIEVTLALSVLLVALVAMSSSTMRMHSLRRQNREQNVAQNAVRTVGEELQSLSRSCVDAPGGWSTNFLAGVAPGGSVGPTFEAPELTPRDGQPTVGRITVVTDETATDAELGFDLGMPRDLDGDGVVGNTNVSATARILPVVLELSWQGSSGDQRLLHPFYVMGY